jgi:hypothetical protein
MKAYQYRRFFRHVFALLFVLSMLGTSGQFIPANRSIAASEAAQPAAIYLPMIQRPAATQPGSRPNIHVTYDAARAVNAEIGPEGGQMTVVGADGTRYDLLISPDAVDFTEMVTMTPVLSADGLPLSGGLLGAVGLEPEGLDLYNTAFLRIIPPATTPDLRILAFAYNGTGAQFHFRPLLPDPVESTVQADAKVIGLEITTLRPVGIGQGTQADVDSIPLTEADLPDPTDYLEELAWRDISRLDDFFRDYVWLAVLESDRSPAKLDEAIRIFDGWLYFVESFRQTETFAAEIADAKRLLAESVEIQGKAASERCFTEKRPEEGFRLLRWMRFARTHISTQAAAALQTRLTKCLTFSGNMIAAPSRTSRMSSAHPCRAVS